MGGTYQRNSYDLGDCIEVEEYHTGRYGAPGQKRAKKRQLTKEEMAEVNRRNRAKLIRRLLRKNFHPGDYWTTLTFRVEERPLSMEVAIQIAQKFTKKMRDAVKRQGEQLKYIIKVERGSKGAYHMHAVFSRHKDLDQLIAKYWTYGRIQNELLYENGQYQKLAEYITKWPGDKKKDGKVISMAEAWYSRSRNLVKVEPKVEIMKGSTMKKEPKKKGYYLEKDSLIEGTNKYTGYKFRYYTLIKLPDNERKKRI